MTRLSPDHLVIGAASLDEGRRWLEKQLGVPACGGGTHALMGTHNALWRLDCCYLEVIAIDPAARPPRRPRWFGLDSPAIQARLRTRPRLLTWVAATNALALDLASAPVLAGEAMAAERDGLAWKIAVPADGLPLAGGAFPTLIEWAKGSRSPAVSLPDQGLSLEGLTVGLNEALWSWLTVRGIGEPVRRSASPGLGALIAVSGKKLPIELD